MTAVMTAAAPAWSADGLMPTAVATPQLIQGGMGVGISGWRLARAVSSLGQLGVVSGTGLDTLFVRRLEDGDADGSLRRAMADFPLPEVCAKVLDRFFRPDGRPAGQPYRALSKFRLGVGRFRQQITVLASFVEVRLARQGHAEQVGINLLTKVQLPNLATLYGAMLAGVDLVLMGAGIPREIPHALDQLAAGRPAAIRLDVEGDPAGDGERVTLDPRELGFGSTPLRRPHFLAIVSSSSLATLLARKAQGTVDGFVVEKPTAGGHNAPPRGGAICNERGEPVYGARDEADLDRIRELGRPFWLAGGATSPGHVHAARARGAAGVQVGTLFAFCRESGLAPELRRRGLELVRSGAPDVFTDPAASPTGFPFKILRLDGTLAEPGRRAARRRVCDLGYLATPYRRPDGALGYRCAAEPVETFVAKGGERAATAGRVCLCNALLATAAHPQSRPGGEVEPPLVTCGAELAALGELAGRGGDYSAADVVEFLLGARRDAVPASAAATGAA
jgi:NAD(P)H-dependent flavin oxidoreductase YrpB (nitropropane dioxygenase family)